MNDLPLAGLGHNQPPAPLADIVDETIDKLIANANQWAAQYPKIESEDVAAEAVNELRKLEARYKQYEEARKAEKKPWDDGAAAVQQKWLPRLERIKACLTVFDRLCDSWAKLKQRRVDAEREARRRKAEEDRSRADQLAEQAAAGGPGTATNIILASEAAQEAERSRQAVAAVPKRAQTRGTLGGRPHSLRTVWKCEIVEQDLVYARFRDHADVVAVLYRLARRAVSAADGPRPADKAKQGLSPALPGCWLFEEES